MQALSQLSYGPTCAGRSGIIATAGSVRKQILTRPWLGSGSVAGAWQDARIDNSAALCQAHLRSTDKAARRTPAKTWSRRVDQDRRRTGICMMPCDERPHYQSTQPVSLQRHAQQIPTGGIRWEQNVGEWQTFENNGRFAGLAHWQAGPGRDAHRARLAREATATEVGCVAHRKTWNAVGHRSVTPIRSKHRAAAERQRHADHGSRMVGLHQVKKKRRRKLRLCLTRRLEMPASPPASSMASKHRV
ncbi:hypothetical protein NB709_003098 [Xanthomonas sacchari]|nr:hypothetical protein [Xanthomonas sacchari]